MTREQQQRPQIQEISSPPSYLTAVQYEEATSSTPQSFAQLPPKLMLQLDNVTLHSDSGFLGIEQGQGQQKGTVWVTESSFSFLSTASSSGFSLPYPLLALHAVSSTLPTESNSIDSTATQCIYCQIDTEDEGDEQDEENGGDEGLGLKELWIIPQDNSHVEPLFSALSHCASLHPSIMDGDGDDPSGGNPFAGMGPFGTGVSSQFDDAQEEDETADENGLSQTGREQLARLDALLDENEEQEQDGRPTSPVETSTSSAPTSNSNVIMVSSHPVAVPTLFSPPMLQSLLALLDAYMPVIGWDPKPEQGQMRVVFNDQQVNREPLKKGPGSRSRRSSFSNQSASSAPKSTGIQRIVDTLHNLPLETEQSSTIQPTLQITPIGWMDIRTLLPSQLSGLPSLSTQFKPTDHLQLPTSDRNFLISPPGSPPIGWEPIIEDPPNRETLANDLMDALKRLGKEMEQDDHQEAFEDSEDEEQEDGQLHIVLPPNRDESIPAVTVQAFDDEQTRSGSASGTGTPADITKVKATVESMRGPALSLGDDLSGGGTGQGGKRITPTGRPPLAS
ncbi:unnamed protein product [Sympodiomycopsis kandeliae]